MVVRTLSVRGRVASRAFGEFPSCRVRPSARDSRSHSTSRMRRVLRSLPSLQRPASARKGYTGSTRAVHARQLPLTQDVLTKSAAPRIVFSGIQPTGIPHVGCAFTNRGYVHANVDPLRQLGNYFGALTNWVKLQSTAAPGDKLFFSVVGWHALTLPQDPNLLSEARTTMMALILASGIDAQRSIVFHQDEVTTQFDLVLTPTDTPNRSRIM